MFTQEQSIVENVENRAVAKLSRDLRNASANMTKQEIRYLVDYYYTIQNDRIRASNRLKAFSDGKEPHEVITWLASNTMYLETQISKALLSYSENDFVGKWSLSVTGIGGVLSSGLLAHIDIDKAPSVSHIYSFAGIAPNGKKWEKGCKRPYNAKLKTLIWKIGESFVKVSGNKNDFYGKVYAQAKKDIIETNDVFGYKEVCEKTLIDKKYSKTTEAYKWYSKGQLPPAHIYARAKRKAIYLFLSHWWEVAYRNANPGQDYPKPYAIAHLGHVDYIPIHNDPFK